MLPLSIHAAAKSRVPEEFVKGRFKINRKLGAGAFATVYHAVDTRDQTEVAIKTESQLATSKPQLQNEYAVLTAMRKSSGASLQGFVECIYYGSESLINFMVIEVLGKSLGDHVLACGGRLCVSTTVFVAKQVLQRIEYLHSRGYVHQDIKPENFMFGVKSKVHHIYMIDFGLSKTFWNQIENAHVPSRLKGSLTGTARYASINAHKGIEQSRRDDLEAAGHMFMYFLRGSLPWSGLDGTTDKHKSILEKKEQTLLEDLCRGYPDLKEYLGYSRKLGYATRPDYNRLYRYLISCRNAGWEDGYSHFQWLEETAPSCTLTPLNSRVNYPQPDDGIIRKLAFAGCFSFYSKILGCCRLP